MSVDASSPEHMGMVMLSRSNVHLCPLLGPQVKSYCCLFMGTEKRAKLLQVRAHCLSPPLRVLQVKEAFAGTFRGMQVLAAESSNGIVAHLTHVMFM